MQPLALNKATTTTDQHQKYEVKPDTTFNGFQVNIASAQPKIEHTIDTSSMGFPTVENTKNINMYEPTEIGAEARRYLGVDSTLSMEILHQLRANTSLPMNEKMRTDILVYPFFGRESSAQSQANQSRTNPGENNATQPIQASDHETFNGATHQLALSFDQMQIQPNRFNTSVRNTVNGTQVRRNEISQHNEFHFRQNAVAQTMPNDRSQVAISAVSLSTNPQIPQSTIRSQIVHRDVPPHYPEYQTAYERYNSFENIPGYPQSNVPTISNFVTNGFFNDTQVNTPFTVRCYQCGIGLRDFTENDDPKVEHIRHTRTIRCTFAEQNYSDNDIASANHGILFEVQKGIVIDDVSARTSHYSTCEARLASFEKWPFKAWPIGIHPTVESMVNAGLFYTGIADLTRCYFCDGGLQKWVLGDQPKQEHLGFFPQCKYAQNFCDRKAAWSIHPSSTYERFNFERSDIERQASENRRNNHTHQQIPNSHRGQIEIEIENALKCFAHLEILHNNERVKSIIKQYLNIKKYPVGELQNRAIEFINDQQTGLLKKVELESQQQSNQGIKYVCEKCSAVGNLTHFMPCECRIYCLPCSNDVKENVGRCPACDITIIQIQPTFGV